jgi:HK97 family phage portal protein
MSIWTKAAQAIKQTIMRFASMGGAWSMLLLNRSQSEYAKYVGDGRGNSAVMACVQWICRTFPEAPIQVLQRQGDGKETPVPDHPMTALLAAPNPYYSGELLLRATLADWVLTGNAYWRKIRNGQGAPIQLWWIPQALIQPYWPIEDKTVFIQSYAYTVDGLTEYLPVADIVHFRDGLDPQNTRKGQSPLASLLREVFTDDEAAAFSATLLHNLGVPGVIISPDADNVEMSQLNADAIKADFKEKFSGDKRGDPMVMAVRARVQVLTFNPQQMDLKTLRRLPEERISAVLGVPAIVAGLGAGLDRSTFANMSEAREMAYESTIIPDQRLFAGDLRTQLLPDFGDAKRLRVAFDLKGVRVLQEDQNKLWERVDTAVRGGWLMVSRAKEMVGETPADGDKVYLRGLSIVESGPDAPEPEPVPAALAAPATTPALPPAGKQLLLAESKSARADQRLILRFRREADRLAERFASDVNGAFENLGSMVKLLPDASKAQPEGAGEWETIEVNLEGTVKRVRIPKDVTPAFQTLYKANFRLILGMTLGTVEDRLGVPVGINLEDLVARDLIEAWATRKGLADVNQQTRDAVMAALAEGRAAGDGAEALARRIRGMVEGRAMFPGVYQEAYNAAKARGWSDAAAEQAGDKAARQCRAERIARTETKTAQNYSSIAAYRHSDVVEELTCYDGDDCGWTDHKDPDKANGKRVSFDEANQYPLAHPDCVRNFAPVVRSSI